MNRDLILLTGSLILLILVGSIVGKELLLMLRLVKAQGIIEFSQVGSEQRTVQNPSVGTIPVTVFYPSVRFTYVVGGKRYSSTRYALVERRYGDESKVERMIAENPPGTTVDVWYDSADPRLAVLVRNFSTLLWILTAAAGAILAYSVRNRVVETTHPDRSRPGLTSTLVAVCFLPLVIGASSPSEVQPNREDSRFPTSQGQRHQVVEEHIYMYEVSKYTPPVEVKLHAGPLEPAFEDPESTLMTYLRAMSEGRYEVAMSCWLPAAREEMEQRDRKLHRSAEWWEREWRKRFEGKSAQLVSRIRTGDYVLLEYRLFLPSGGEYEYFSTLALKLATDGKWLLTQELAADPVFVFWKNPGYVVRKIIRDVN